MIIKKAILIIMLALLFSACQKTEETTLVIIDAPKISEETLSNPEILMTSVICELIFSPLLYEIDNRLTPYNVLAKEVKIHNGNKVIEVKLKEGVRYHDGREFTANDILPAVAKLRKDLVSRHGDTFKGLKAEVIDKTSFRLINTYPMIDTNMVLTGIYAWPPNFSGKPAGTGPFKINKWLANGVELVANEDYFEDPPRLKKIIYIHEADEEKRLTKLLEGEADLMLYLTPQTARLLEEDKNFYVNKLSHNYYSALFFNNRSPLFGDIRIRKAVSMAINKKEIIEKGLKTGGMRTFGPFSNLLSKKPESQEYRPQESLKLLSEAGWIREKYGSLQEKNGKKLRLSLYYTKGIEEYKRVVNFITLQLFDVGIEVKGIPIEHGEFMKLKKSSNDYDAYLTMVNSRESYNYIHWHSTSGSNLASFNNKEVDRLLMTLRENNEAEDKKVIYSRLQDIFNREVPAAFLYNYVIYTAVNKKFIGAEDFAGNVFNIYKIKDWRPNGDYRRN